MTSTTRYGYTNPHRQRNLGPLHVPGTHFLNAAFLVNCLDCGHFYGANGCDLHHRKCPSCQGGVPGIPVNIEPGGC